MLVRDVEAAGLAGAGMLDSACHSPPEKPTVKQR